MENYVVIKDLPDAYVGTDVVWDESMNSYYYKKSAYVSPHDKAYLTAGQVAQNPDFFCKQILFPEHYAYNENVFSRKEILDLIKKSFPNKSMSGSFNLSASKEIKKFEDLLRELGKNKAVEIIKKNEDEI